MPNGPFIYQVWMVEPRAATAAGTLNGVPRLRDSTGSKLLRFSAGKDHVPASAAIAGDYPAHIPSDEELRPHAVNWKVLDGHTWMSAFDARGVSGPADWAARVRDFQGRELALTPWVVPVGLDHLLEVERISQILSITPEMVLNVEYWGDQYFWQGGRAGIRPYMELLRERHPRADLTLQYDTRNPDTIHLEEWLPYVDRVIDMSYWPDFGEDMRTVLFRSYHRMKVLGKPFSFTFPGTASRYPDWEITERPIYIFRRGNMTPACIEMVKAARSLPEPEPRTVEQKIDDLYHELVRRSVQLEELQGRVETLEKKLAAVRSVI